LQGRYARVSRLRRCIRAPNVTFQGCCCSPVAVARRAWMCVDAAVEAVLAVWRSISWRCSRTSRAVCTGECVSWSNPPHAPLNSTHFRQPSGPASASLSPILDNNTPAPRVLRAAVACCLSPPPPRLAFCCCCRCCCCCWVESIAAPQTVLHPHTCRRI
jgi:hypothetical protein